MTLLATAVVVRVPATSANLGPGFDSLGLALDVHDELIAMVTEDEGVLIEVDGEGADSIARDETHLVVQAMRVAFAALGEEPVGFVLRCRNVIPQGRGMGSSAAAIVGGLVLARGMVVDGETRLPDDALLALATSMEGHPDNVAAALYGGFTIAWGASGVEVGAVRCDVHADVVPVVLVPGDQVLTTKARTVLPEQVSHEDAAFNVSRAALLVHAISHAPEQLLIATDDRLHQSARAGVYPDTYALVLALREQGIPAVVSGSGPTVLALASPTTLAAAIEHAPAGWIATRLAVAPYGAVVVPR